MKHANKGNGKRPAHPRDRELLSLQRSTDLLRLALSYGYRRPDGRYARENPGSRRIWLRHPATRDSIVLKRGQTGWSYVSEDDPSDRGSAVDFLLRRRRLGIWHVRKELRYWSGEIRTK